MDYRDTDIDMVDPPSKTDPLDPPLDGEICLDAQEKDISNADDTMEEAQGSPPACSTNPNWQNDDYEPELPVDNTVGHLPVPPFAVGDEAKYGLTVGEDENTHHHYINHDIDSDFSYVPEDEPESDEDSKRGLAEDDYDLGYFENDGFSDSVNKSNTIDKLLDESEEFCYDNLPPHLRSTMTEIEATRTSSPAVETCDDGDSDWIEREQDDGDNGSNFGEQAADGNAFKTARTQQVTRVGLVQGAREDTDYALCKNLQSEEDHAGAMELASQTHDFQKPPFSGEKAIGAHSETGLPPAGTFIHQQRLNSIQEWVGTRLKTGYYSAYTEKDIVELGSPVGVVNNSAPNNSTEVAVNGGQNSRPIVGLQLANSALGTTDFVELSGQPFWQPRHTLTRTLSPELGNPTKLRQPPKSDDANSGAYRELKSDEEFNNTIVTKPPLHEPPKSDDDNSRPTKRQRRDDDDPSKASAENRIIQRAKKQNAVPEKIATSKSAAKKTTAPRPGNDTTDTAPEPTPSKKKISRNQMSPEQRRKDDLETRTRRECTWKPDIGVSNTTTPRSKFAEFFRDLAQKAIKLGLDEKLKKWQSLKVATLCSGTESPILAFEEILNQLENLLGDGFENCFTLLHAFSAEIVPFKQRFIEKNFKPNLIFRDVMDMLCKDFGKATTVYGASALIPKNLDIVFAGFACVDFSMLNSNRRAIDEGGQSGNTFNATRTYSDKARPILVILENVDGAPWLHAKLRNKHGKSTGIDRQMHNIGYSSCLEKLNSKDYHIPQCRKRGYMICVCLEQAYNQRYGTTHTKLAWSEWKKAVLEATPFFGNKKQFNGRLAELRDILTPMFERYKTILKTFFACPASVPVDKMLIDEEDPILDCMRPTSFRTADGQEKKEVAWVRCKVEHQNYREDLGLGPQKPISGWQNQHSFTLPFWFHPQPGLTTRTLDVLDIAHLRTVNRGVDDRYFCRQLELSQNVFRYEDHEKSGIQGCLTTNGMPWSTTRGRRLNGVEAMRLQGLPIERLDLNGFTQSNLQDLAGNAMTSTVVAAVFLSALETFSTILDGGSISSRINSTQPVPAPADPVTGLTHGHAFATDRNPQSVRDVTQLALSTIRLCSIHCKKHLQHYKLCQHCGQTACPAHFGKPKHEYVSAFRSNIEAPNAFVDRVKSAVPSHWEFNADTWSLVSGYIEKHPERVDFGKWDAISGMVEEALTSPVWLQNIKRVGSTWELRYESTAGILTCTVTGVSVKWLFWVNGTQLPWDDRLNQQGRKHPILRMIPNADSKDFTEGNWELWLPESRHVPAQLTSHAAPDVLQSSYPSKLGIVDSLGKLVSSQVTLQLLNPDDAKCFKLNIQGVYILHQECAQAFDTFHVLSGEFGNRLFLFLDHENSEGHPDSHPFILTDNVDKLAAREARRSVFGRLMNTDGTCWRQPIWEESEMIPEDKTSQIMIDIGGEWAPCDGIGRSQGDSQLINFGYIPACYTLPAASNCSVAGSIIVLHAQTDLPRIQPTINFSRSDISSILRGVSSSLTSKQIITVIKGAEPDSLKQLSWIFLKVIEKLVPLRQECGWQNWSDNHDDIRHCFCSTCFPKPPPVTWTMRQISGKSQLKLAPIEDPEAAGVYERQLKSRSRGLVLHFQALPTGEVNIKLHANPVAMIHQATAQLNSSALWHPTNSLQNDTQIVHSWQLRSDDAHSDLATQTFHIKDINEAPVSAGQEFNCELPDSAKHFFKSSLSGSQRAAVEFLFEQENNPKLFLECEIVEDRLRIANHVLLAKSERKIPVLGSVAAFDVGFGKTVLTLALKAFRHAEDLYWSQQRHSRAIPIKATMVFVPTQLTIQWKAEAEFHTHLKVADKEILLIESIGSLKGFTIQQFLDAELIIVADKLSESPEYMDRLASFSGMPVDCLNRAENSKGARRAWYGACLTNVQKFATELLDEEKAQTLPGRIMDMYNGLLKQARLLKIAVPLQDITEDLYERKQAAAIHQDTQELEAAKWRKSHKIEYKLKGANEAGIYLDQVDDVGLDETVIQMAYNDLFDLVQLTEPGGYKQLKGPVLEMFAPARLVVDEFHYHKETSMTFLQLQSLSGNSNSRLLLSATPKLATFNDIKMMGKLMCINLGADDYRNMPYDVFKGKDADMSVTEQLAMSTDSVSRFLGNLRHENAQAFLDQFFRTGEAMNPNVQPPQHNFHIVRLPVASRLSYSMDQSKLDKFRLDNLSDNEDPLGDLSKRACYPESDMTCNEISDELRADVDEIQTDIRIKLREILILNQHNRSVFGNVSVAWNSSKWLDTGSRWIKRARGMNTGDSDCDSWIVQTISDSYKPETKIRNPVAHYFKFGIPTGLSLSKQHQTLPASIKLESDLVASLNELSSKLVAKTRLLRISTAARDISSSPNLDCELCEQIVAAKTLKVLCTCGHRFCVTCYQKMLEAGRCVVPGCTGTYEPYKVMFGEDLVPRGSLDALIPGAKSAAIVALIRGFSDDKFIIFSQYPTVLARLSELLKANSLSSVNMSKLKDADKAAALMNFAFNANPRVLLLNIADSSAAGSNLTIANHVIFVSPYHVEGSDGQDVYDATMRQAVGRALRRGQNKPVFIHHYFAEKTVDVDLLEHRNRDQQVLRVTGTSVLCGRDCGWFPAGWPGDSLRSPCKEMLCKPDNDYA
ncbi:hypothetical protein BJ878DRAFT_569704 [Calycina marina]|uniref:SNF2 N-terminal domain-containing protein n=1 Tax=Calycina marina TaxID=1763456 RepID=A0A9P7YY38_9HELO|nr:hypothetical protein BJ878DRAFT_569704 [Calycina marina]